TEALLSAVPSVYGTEGDRIPLTGEIPSPKDPPPGCVFHTRCHRFIPGKCDVEVPEIEEVAPGHSMACHIPVEQLVELRTSASSN
ncbi:MAG: ABC transporter ATP-binding protein, partial [Actinomycetota bacterium]|nr:ABC transporter ATP-binding protein [Actinomycetota bacterium]